jgi:hypothetical protein
VPTSDPLTIGKIKHVPVLDFAHRWKTDPCYL